MMREGSKGEGMPCNFAINGGQGEARRSLEVFLAASPMYEAVAEHQDLFLPGKLLHVMSVTAHPQQTSQEPRGLHPANGGCDGPMAGDDKPMWAKEKTDGGCTRLLMNTLQTKHSITRAALVLCLTLMILGVLCIGTHFSSL